MRKELAKDRLRWVAVLGCALALGGCGLTGFYAPCSQDGNCAYSERGRWTVDDEIAFERLTRATDPIDHSCLVDRNLASAREPITYNGISLGGIMGSATKAVLDDVFEAALDQRSRIHRRAQSAAQVLYDPIIAWVRNDLKIEVSKPNFTYDSQNSAILVEVAMVSNRDLFIWAATGKTYGNIFTNLDPEFSGDNRYRFGAQAEVRYEISLDLSGTKADITGYIDIYPYLARQTPGSPGFFAVERYKSACVDILADVLWTGHTKYFQQGVEQVRARFQEINELYESP